MRGVAMLQFWDVEKQVSEPGTGDKSFTQRAIAVLPDGRIVVVRNASQDSGDGNPSEFGSGIRARILNVDGTPASDEFVVNSTTVGAQTEPAVAVLSDGRIIFTWTSSDTGDGGSITNDGCIRARVFDSNGQPAEYNGSTDDFIVNTAPGYIQYAPEVSALNGGGFVITFSGSSVENGFAPHDIEMRVFTATGPAGAEQTISGSGVHNPGSSAITQLSGGRFVVAWTADSNGLEVTARIFNADGTPATGGGAGFALATTSQGAQTQVHIATLSDGRFVAAWTSEDAGGSSGAADGSMTAIRARVFLANGTADPSVNGGDDFLVNVTTDADQRRANIIALKDGGFLITFWSREDPVTGESQDMILGRQFDATGAGVGPEFILNDGDGISGGATPGTPHDLVRTADGRIFAIYGNEPGSDGAVVGRFLDEATTGKLVNGKDAAENIAGTHLNDTLDGNGGSDYLAAGDGRDDLRGGIGADTLNGGSGADRMLGGGGRDQLSGEDDRDVLKGGQAKDTLDGGLGIDKLSGGGGGDVFVFTSRDAAHRDVITDLDVAVDHIDLSAIDASDAVPGDQSFTFIGNAAFTAEGQIRAVRSGLDTVLYVNTSGDSVAEFSIRLKDFVAGTLTESVFLT